MFKMKTKIILLLFVAVFISSVILLYMLTDTFKKDKISYVYEVITSQTQSVATQIKNELESIDLVVSKIHLESNQGFTEFESLKYFALIRFQDGKIETISENMKDNFIKDITLLDSLFDKIKTLDTIEKKYFYSKNDVIYEVVLSQKEPYPVAAVIGYESENINEFIDKNANDQYSFILKNDLQILAGSQEQLDLFSGFIEANKTRKWEDSQSGQISSNQKESWIYSVSTIGNSDLMVLNLISEKKAFSVMKTIYIKSFFSFILIMSLVVILGIIAATYLTDKLNQLTEATRQVAEGQLNTEINFSGSDEIASLSKDFNVMVRQIKKLLEETAEQARMENELKTAQLVQENLFPEPEKKYSNCAVIGYCKPASECGGDWWFHSEDEHFVNIIIADATGHGVPAALMTSAIKSAFILTAKMNLTPQETMTKINEALCEVGRNKVMMTAFYLRINKSTNSAEYVNASHESPFILDTSLDSIDKSNLIFLNENNSARLGQSSDTVYKSSLIQFNPRQRIFMYTDGIFDLKNNDLKKLTERSFFKNVIELANQKNSFNVYSEDVKKFIFDYHTQKNLDDDVTLCHIEIV